jgi:hypothetical protein
VWPAVSPTTSNDVDAPTLANRFNPFDLSAPSDSESGSLASIVSSDAFERVPEETQSNLVSPDPSVDESADSPDPQERNASIALRSPGTSYPVDDDLHFPIPRHADSAASLLSHDSASSDSAESPASSSGSDAKKGDLLASTSDGGPSLARPIVVMSLSEPQTQKLIDEALAAAAPRLEKLAGEIAESKVEHAFWVRYCHERAILGND